MSLKRVLLICVTLFCVTTTSFAMTPGALLDEEIKSGDVAIEVYLGKTDFNKLKPYCDKSFIKDYLNKKQVTEGRRKIAEVLGILDTVNFVQYTKLFYRDKKNQDETPFDRVIYVAIGSTKNKLLCIFDFDISGEKVFIRDASFTLEQALGNGENK